MGSLFWELQFEKKEFFLVNFIFLWLLFSVTTVESGKRALEWLGVGNEASSKVFLQCIDICHFAVGVFHYSCFFFSNWVSLLHFYDAWVSEFFFFYGSLIHGHVCYCFSFSWHSLYFLSVFLYCYGLNFFYFVSYIFLGFSFQLCNFAFLLTTESSIW